MVNIKIKKFILLFLSIIAVLYFGHVSRSIFLHSIDKIHEIKINDLSVSPIKSSDGDRNTQPFLRDTLDADSWVPLSDFSANYSKIISGKDIVYLRIKLQEGEWTNPAIYLEGINAASYEAYFNGRIVYKSSYNILGKDLSLDTTYRDVIIPLDKPNLDTESNILKNTNVFNEDYLIIKMYKGNNKNIGPIIKDKSILMGEHKDIISYTIKNSIKKIVLNSIIAAIAIFCTILGLLFRGRDRKILLSLSLFSLCMVGYGVSLISSINSILMDSPITWDYLFYASFAYGPYLFAYFFEHLFGQEHRRFKFLKRIEAVSGHILMGTTLLYTITRGKINLIPIGSNILYAALLVLIIATLIVSITGAVKRNSEALIFTAGISIYIFYIISAAINKTYINETGLIFFIFSLIMLTVRRFFQMNQNIISNSKELEIKNTELQLAWEKINTSKEEIFELNKTLEKRVQDRTRDLEVSNEELKITLEKLQQTQNKLIQSEKMVALGGLVAGVSHEINTPIGISVTAASHLQEKTKEINLLYNGSAMKKSDLEKYLTITNESSEAILSNLQRASELVRSFKQVAVDQSDEQKRSFKINDYIHQVLLSLKPKLKKTRISIGVNCDTELEIHSFPGALSQIITNLVMNSLIHGFDEGAEGTIIFDIEKQGSNILFNYSDSGKGIREDIIGKIFDPFFTTKRGNGGTGLGLNIVYNLVTQTLGGNIECHSEVNVGTIFKITFPVD